MIEDIEQGIIDRLKALWPDHGGSTALNVFDIGNDFSDVVGNAAISIATESIGLSTLPDLGIKLTPQTSVYLCFKHVANAKGRRFGAYPMVLGVIGILTGQDLDLDIDYLMPAGAAQEIYHETLKSKGLVGWKIPFTTSFDIERLGDDETAVALISEGLFYHLREDAEENGHDELSYT